MIKKNNRELRLGIIGLSEGNGHPYSWSAIFNGYQAKLMADCGYPVIPDYLTRQSWPDACIPHVKVTHIWTQDIALSHKIAKAAYIDHVAENINDLIGVVDAVLLARDDAEYHLEMAAPFLEAGLPIYIDKPICLTLSDLNKFYALQQYPGQIFSCSALRYADELVLSDQQKNKIGKLRYIQAITPKDWNRYSIHVIDPLLNMIGDQGKLVFSQRYAQGDICSTHYTWASGLQASVTSVGKLSIPISFRLIGEKGVEDLVFNDTFTAFKTALNHFVEGVFHKHECISYESTYKRVDMIERGRQCESELACSEENRKLCRIV